jgi:hypothetical protein
VLGPKWTVAYSHATTVRFHAGGASWLRQAEAHQSLEDVFGFKTRRSLSQLGNTTFTKANKKYLP